MPDDAGVGARRDGILRFRTYWRVTALLNLDEIAQRLVSTVTNALNVASAALYLDDGSDTYHPVAVVGEAAERLVSIQPRRGHAVVELIAQRRRGTTWRPIRCWRSKPPGS